MKRTILILLIFIFSDYAYSGQAPGPDPVTISERREMEFALIIPDSLGDVITLTPSENISGQSTSLFSGRVQAAEFIARGEKNSAITISFSSGDFLSGSGANMPLGNFTHDAGFTPTLAGNGRLIFSVGADLTINAGQTSGVYSGTYTVTVDYP